MEETRSNTPGAGVVTVQVAEGQLGGDQHIGGGDARLRGDLGNRATPTRCEPSAPLISCSLPREPGCGAITRRLLAAHLEGLVDRQSLADAKLVASELVSNAYMHGEGEIRLCVTRSGHRLRLEVIDDGSGAALRIRQQRHGKPGGHGLRVVDALSLAWGAHEGTTHVWAELPTHASAR